MQPIGCKYFPAQGGYCRNVPTGFIDEQCVLQDNRCYTEAEYITRFKLEPPPRVPIPGPVPRPISEGPLLPPKEILKASPGELQAIRRGLEYISGPVSWYYFELPPEALGEHRRFHFFGDVHYSKSGNCTDRYGIPCAYINNRLQPVDINPRCYDITYLLMELFDRSKRERTYTDFFLEYPFKIAGLNKDELDEIAMRIRSREVSTIPMLRQDISIKQIVESVVKSKELSNLDYISSIYVIFNECFQPEKQGCHYNPYVRFHYVDVRFTTQMEYEGPITINSYLINQVDKIEQLMMIYYKTISLSRTTFPQAEQLRQNIIESVEFTNRLIDKILTRGQTLRGETINYNKELFNAALSSRNYPVDVDRILDILVEGIPARSSDRKDFDKLRRAMKAVVTQRNGDIMHRVGAELRELEAENVIYRNRNMADLIRDFVQRKYQEANITSVYTLWKRFYNSVYLPFSRMVTERDVDNAINAFKSYIQLKRADILINLMDTDAIIMDAYMLARMFRKFTTPRKGRPPHNPSDLVITYTGDAHTDNYVQFFQQYLNIQPIDYRKNTIGMNIMNNRCLQDPNFGTYFDIPRRP